MRKLTTTKFAVCTIATSKTFATRAPTAWFIVSQCDASVTCRCSANHLVT